MYRRRALPTYKLICAKIKERIEKKVGQKANRCEQGKSYQGKKKRKKVFCKPWSHINMATTCQLLSTSQSKRLTLCCAKNLFCHKWHEFQIDFFK
jgi:hypothetical protein